MPVLVSAAAISLTFGLKDFRLPFYKYIRIYPEEYISEDCFKILAGNVQDNIITIAWNHFLKGYSEALDGVNVGLHEMAHALYFQYFQTDWCNSKNFEIHFNEILTDGKQVYELKGKQQLLFSNYAFTDLQEFWAESIEIFFERPVEMQQQYAELYNDIKSFLRQDPIKKIDPLLQ